jgi:HAD superfamily hydrolase (TIGR01490 family)
MPQTKSYIVFFDLDKTIISINSGSLLVKLAYKRGLMSTLNLLNAILQGYLYKFNLRDTTIIISKMGTWVKGLDQKVIEEFSRDIVNNYLKFKIRPEIIEEINFHKQNNAGIVILSSAIYPLCEAISNSLDIDEIICTTLESENGILTGAPVGKFCFGEEKRERLLSFCKEKNYNPSEAWYYADSISDLAAFEAVGHQVCVSPDRKLATVATKRGWKIFRGE